MDKELINELEVIKILLFMEKNEKLSIDEVISFLNKAMYLSDFQIEILKNENKLSDDELLCLFLKKTPYDKILVLYDICGNIDMNNFDTVAKMIKKR